MYASSPQLISGRKSTGRLHSVYTVFDESWEFYQVDGRPLMDHWVSCWLRSSLRDDSRRIWGLSTFTLYQN